VATLELRIILGVGEDRIIPNLVRSAQELGDDFGVFQMFLMA
jgi:hypothetical protein